MTKSAYYDDLDPGCLVGNIHIRAAGFSKLWDLCDVESLRVVADIHTHPGASVAQSSIDRANPMIAREGHLALYRAATTVLVQYEQGRLEFMSIAGPWLEIMVWLKGRTRPPHKEQVNGHTEFRRASSDYQARIG